MGDGGDGDVVDYSAAELPVEFGTEVVEAAAGAPGDDFDDLVVSGEGGGIPGRTQPEEAVVVEMTWADPNIHSGP